MKGSRINMAAVSVGLCITDCFLGFGSALVSSFYYLGDFELRPHYSIATMLLVLMMIFVLPVMKIYQNPDEQWSRSLLGKLFLSWSTCFLVLALFALLTKTGASFSRGWYITWYAVGLFALFSYRYILNRYIDSLKKRGLFGRSVLIVGDSASMDAVAARLRSDESNRYLVSGVFEIEEESLSAAPSYREDTFGLGDLVHRKKIEEVWITASIGQESVLRYVLESLDDYPVNIRFLPNMSNFKLLNYSSSQICDLPAIDLSTSNMGDSSMLLKTWEDRLIAGCAMLILSPLMLLIAAGVKFTSPGPVFYKQERIGWNGRPFRMIKFRTMPVNAEQTGVVWGNSAGMTESRFAAFLRRNSLDELPQFWNVLVGDMSVVGPRPERTTFVNEFKQQIPSYMKKHLVKAGITGWAQVNGYRGDTSLHERLRHDLYYIENWSLWFDFWIIWLTVFGRSVKSNAE
ncbi:MAG: undecaprenyl-phosphate glucose phosphotransferase [Pseudomonadota bacterium]